ncbi:hypothetical protein AMECASPLE_013224 [Ameca splendens]|uniref:Uncharacterized protein n=1 Tax=Ameca splendens TaxID=208324 RepID=A0ABV1A985_9TELE
MEMVGSSSLLTGVTHGAFCCFMVPPVGCQLLVKLTDYMPRPEPITLTRLQQDEQVLVAIRSRHTWNVSEKGSVLPPTSPPQG